MMCCIILEKKQRCDEIDIIVHALNKGIYDNTLGGNIQWV